MTPLEQLRRRHASQRAVAAGHALEQWVDGQHAEALRLGLAEVRQVSPAVAIVRMNRDGSFTGRFRGPSGVDRRGTLAGGRSLLVEVKSTEGATLARSAFTPAEADDLQICERLDGLALLVWEVRPTCEVFAIPWRFMPWRASGGGQGIAAEDVEAWRVDRGPLPYLRRFVPAGLVKR